MFAKDLFELKPGTFIKGITIEKPKTDRKGNFWGRIAYLNVSGWEGEMSDGMTEIKTPFYKSLSDLKTYNGKEAKDLLSILEYSAAIPTEQTIDLGDICWLTIKQHDPVGIHLNEFALCQDEISDNVVVYSKVLNRVGEIGFIVLSCSCVLTKPLELI